MKTAVIITTYNRPDALARVLEGYRVQADRDFEVIVADDGSAEETRSVADEFRARGDLRLTHIWQEDLGFRAAAARNRAIAATDAEYIIFTDGDCIPARRFVGAHKRLAEPGYFLAANRILLSASLTNRVMREGISIHLWNSPQWLRSWFKRDVNRLWPLMVLPDGVFRKYSPRQWAGAKTCNLSVWRNDLVTVNGLDESYHGWGLEDSDLVIRLIHAGVKRKSARFAAPVFHLWHPEHDRTGLRENQHRLDQLLGSSTVRASLGLDQYLS